MDENLTLEDMFDENQVQNLVFAFIKGSKPGGATTEDVETFLRACVGAKFVGHAIDLAAEGRISLKWDMETGEFTFFL